MNADDLAATARNGRRFNPGRRRGPGNGITYGSLFTGVGGFDLGCEQAGWDCRWQCEINQDCRAVLARHWPRLTRHADVRDVSGEELAPVDVIAFGSPCQNLSVAGNRTGIMGEESGLFLEAIRVIQEMQSITDGAYPRAVIWENVIGALNSNKGNDFATVLQELADCWPVAIEWRVLDAQYFGVPQRRRRVFLVAVFDPGIKCAGPIFPESESLPRDLAASRHAKYSNTKRIKGSPRKSRRAVRRAMETTDVVGTLMARGGRNNVDDHYDPSRESLVIGFNHTQTPINSLDMAMTLGVQDGGGAVFAKVPRRFTPVERERLMGWPDQHTAYGSDGRPLSDTTRARMTGNGVVSPVARWVAECLTSQLI